MALDTQVVELLGRHRLMGELLRDGLEVAVPARDRGVDLIAYADLSLQVVAFAARPIQMKAFTTSGFSVARKYTKIADLIVAYVWHVGGAEPAVTYALPYPEVVRVAEAMGWTGTASWKDGGAYTTTNPSQKLLGLLEPYRMGPGKWWALVTGSEGTPNNALQLTSAQSGPGSLSLTFGKRRSPVAKAPPPTPSPPTGAHRRDPR